MAACSASETAHRAVQALSATVNADSMGVTPASVHSVRMNEPSDLQESSAAVMSSTQPGVFFTINDSGNDPALFALDTTGKTRGRWRVTGASNNDWEAASRGTCLRATAATTAGAACLFLGDVGDNGAVRPDVKLYQVTEPTVTRDMTEGELRAETLVVRYPDGPHDVEAMYVGPTGNTYLLTKRPLKNTAGTLRQALVFEVPVAAWASHDTVTATLLDSLPIVPGSSSLRRLTDASLSDDSRFLAIRTYGQIYIFATDTTSGRVINAIAPATCNIENIEALPGEGITWLGSTSQLLLTREGQNAPIQIVTCPLPQR
ncbi:MAG: hypothetical protein ABJB74_21180 [Gemmatimonas sp.]